MDRTEQEALYRTYHPKVLRYVRGKVGRGPDVEDVVSAVFVKVYDALDSFDPAKGSLSTWIYAIARNAVVDYYRQEGARPLPLDETIPEPASPDMDGMLDELSEALAALPERQRDIVILHYRFGFSHQEIAEKLGLSCANTRKLCSLALGALREMLTRT